MNNIIKISIILPTYNGAVYIAKAVESVLNQTFNNWELLIIDDGSQDNTENVIKKYLEKDSRILYFKNMENLGIQKTLNKGLNNSKGEYIARIDDDDEWIDKDKITNQIKFFEANPGYVLVGTGVINVDEYGKELFRYLLPEKDKDIRNKILTKNCFIHSSVMFKKNVAMNLGGYSEGENVRHIEDYDLWLQMGNLGKFYNFPIYMTRFTLRKESISSINKFNQFKKSIFLIKKFKRNYPNYFFALIRSHLRKLIYGFIINSPFKFYLNKLIKFYKNNW